MGLGTVITGKISELKFEEREWGQYARLFTDWGGRWNGHYARIKQSTSLLSITTLVGKDEVDCIGVVDKGEGAICPGTIYEESDEKFHTYSYDNFTHNLHEDNAFRMHDSVKNRHKLPLHSHDERQRGIWITSGGRVDEVGRGQTLDLFIVEQTGDGSIDYKTVDPESRIKKPYEYESRAQEVFTYPEDGKMGLLRFEFPGQGIPIHTHPHSARVIKGISGKGFTYIEPDFHPMSADDYALIPTGHVHTNGALPGTVSEVWAFQLPWIVSQIDEENIAGDPRFVQYKDGFTLPRELWKTPADFERLVKALKPT